MQLKKLEIKGFKSFGDRVEILFHEGVTGIVGPNGCGKSNVVDAIRWVLGEQKIKALRSDKMESVIFNGTQTRKPAQMAEVSLTFDNNKQLLPAEYTQITITRRYYRSGESEYLLNQVPCRLRDITNLFLDTGIGSDSYAIIELKMIDEILNDKDNSRRGLFEKAAGISKFKTRKKETLNRLAEVDTDLARLNDLLVEIEKNLKNLEKQAKQAERYFSLKQEYKTISLQYAKKAMQRQQEEYKNLAQKKQAEQEKKQKIYEYLHKLEKAVESQKMLITNFEQDFYQKQKTYNEHLNQLRQLENEHKIKVERLGFGSEKIDTQKKQIQQDSQHITDLKQELLALEQKANIAQKQAQEQEIVLKESKQNLDYQRNKIQELQEQLKYKRQETEKIQQQLFQLNKQFDVKQSQLVSMRLQLEKLMQADSQQNATVTQYAQELQELETALAEARQKYHFLQKQEEEKQQRILQLEEILERKRKELAEILRLNDSKKNEYTLTKSLVDNMEGFPEALKFLKKNTEWSKNAQLLSDLIACQEEYKVAIENFLEPYINYYVVETELEAYKAIHFLRQDLKGKANFFVLDNLITNPKLTESSNGQVQATAALAVIETETKYAQLVQQLLKDVYVVENQDDIKNYEHLDKTFITKDGSIIKKKTSLSGGSVGAFEGKRIGRVKHLEKLIQEIENLQDQMQTTEQEIEHVMQDLQNTKQHSLKKAIEDAQKEINQINERYISLKTKKEQVQNLLSHSSVQKEDLQADISQWQYELQELSPQIKSLQEMLQDNLAWIETQQDNLQAENEQVSQISSLYNQQNMAFFQQQNTHNALVREIDFKTQNLINLQKRVESSQKELAMLYNEIEQLKQNNLFENEQISQKKQQTPAIEQALKQAEIQYYAAKGNIAEQEKDLRDLNKRREEADFITQQLNERLHESQLALTSIQERLSAEFQINPALLLAEQNTEHETDKNESELKKTIEELREKMERIGTINPMAMEAYNEMKQRYDFMQGQKNDLLGSKTALLKTIEEMETYATQAFMQAFEAIRANFIKVFRSLFSEHDTCDLLLTEPKNPLESDIDIVAKPKGKRPLSINQLSGGEKTLTATSLLFALYLLKPAPFCIFDEVDAPLDDANTDKFNNIIKNFSQDSQFLLVTHNKRTMLMADVLYGITMVEQGISRTVPVDLQSLK